MHIVSQLSVFWTRRVTITRRTAATAALPRFAARRQALQQLVDTHISLTCVRLFVRLFARVADPFHITSERAARRPRLLLHAPRRCPHARRAVRGCQHTRALSASRVHAPHFLTGDHKKPAICVKELHSYALQDASTHRLLNKLCLLMNRTRTMLAQTSCPTPTRLGAVFYQCKWSAAATEAKQKEATTISLPLSAWTVAHWRWWCKGCTRARRPQCCRRNPSPPRTLHSVPENRWANTSTIVEPATLL